MNFLGKKNGILITISPRFVLGGRIDNKFSYSKVHGATMGPTWVLSAPDGPHVGPVVNLVIRVSNTLGVGMALGRQHVITWSNDG